MNYIVNPYHIFSHHYFKNFLQEKEHTVSNRMTTFYKAKHSKPTSIIMGSSRVGMFDTDIFKKYLGTENFVMAMPGANIEEQSQYLLYMIKNHSIKNIVWSLDFFSFNPDLENDSDFVYNRLSNSYLLNDDYKITLFSLQATQNSLKTIFDNLRLYQNNEVVENSKAKRQKVYDAYQAFTHKEIDEYTAIQITYYPSKFLKNKHFIEVNSLEKNIKKVQLVLDLCKEKNIKTYLYTSPVSASFLDLYKKLGLEKTFFQWKKELSSITSYTDFAQYNSISNNPYNFIDGTHILTNFGPLIFARVFNDSHVKVPKDFGINIEKSN